MDLEKYDAIQAKLNEKKVKLIAVSKTKPAEDIETLYKRGQRIFGENKVQDLCAKFEALPKDIEWHMIGHLQRNKVKYIAPFISLIHSVDSPRLLKEINKRALQNERVIDCLLQVYINQDDDKFGLEEKELYALLESDKYHQCKNVRICGLMGMATFTDDETQVKREFHYLKQLFEQVKAKYFASNRAFNEVSMGMSGDYELAVEEGSTMVRIGSLIFGPRDYSKKSV